MPAGRGASPTATADLVLLYILAALHVAVLLALPVAVWMLALWLRISGRKVPGGLEPALVAAGIVVEGWLAWRLIRLRRRLRALAPRARG